MYNRVRKNYDKNNDEVFLVQAIHSAYRECRNQEGITLATNFVMQNKGNQLVWKILGELYKRVNKLPKAISAYKKAIFLNPNDSDCHNNLGLLYKMNNQLSDAEKSYRKAILKDPMNILALNNLSNLLRQLGKIEEAEKVCRDAIKIKPEYNMALMNLAIILEYRDDTSECELILKRIIKSQDKLLSLQAKTHLAIICYLKNRFVESIKLLEESKEIQNIQMEALNNERIYHNFLSKILNNPTSDFIKPDTEYVEKLFVVGDSHTLSSHGLHVNFMGIDFLCEASLIKGCKQWDLAKSGPNQFKNHLEIVLRKIPINSNVLLSFGEIDCRFDSGIIKNKEKNPRKSIDDIIEKTVNGFIIYISELNKEFNHNLIFQAVPCPNLQLMYYAEGNYQELNYVINSFNILLKRKVKEIGQHYLDIHSLTNRGDGFSNNKYHVDGYHLSRDAMIKAWKSNL